MARIVVPAISIVLAFLVSTQIEMMHHLGRSGLWTAVLVVALIMIGTDYGFLSRRFGIMGRIFSIFAIFVAIWVCNSVSTMSTCNRATHRCHKVFPSLAAK